MSRSGLRQVGLLTLLLLGFLGRPVAADTVASYQIRGPGATILWGLDQGLLDTEVMVFAFSDLAPVQGDKPPPGPRVFFSVTRLSAVGFTLIRRQWYGDVALKANALTVSPDLGTAKLEAEVAGTLEERLSPGGVTRRAAKGTLKIQWVANDALANTTLAFSTQGTPVAVQLNVVGQGRLGQATLSLSADVMGAPIQLVGPGSLLSPSVGTLTLTLP